MKDSEFHQTEEDFKQLLSDYKEACEEMGLNFETEVKNCIEELEE